MSSNLNINARNILNGKLSDLAPFFKERYIIITKILLVVFAPLALYLKDLSILFLEALENEFSSHILAIPFLLFYIIYRKRKIIYSSIVFNSDYNNMLYKRDSIIGFLLCFLSYIIKWYGSYTFYSLEIHIFSIPIFLCGIILLVFNLSTLISLIFPILFLLFLIPPPITILQYVGSILSYFSSRVAYNFLKIINLPVSLSEEIGSPIITLITSRGIQIPFAIDIACSGLYSLIGFLLFAIFSSYIIRGKYRYKMIILIMGIPIIYLLNVFRIIFIIIIGYYSGPNLALNIFHLLGGWSLIFIGTILLLSLSIKIFDISFYSVKINDCSDHDQVMNYCNVCGKIIKYPNLKLSKIDIIKYITISMALIPLLFFQVPVFTLTRGFAEVLVHRPGSDNVEVNALPLIEGYDFPYLYERDYEFENISGQDASLMYRYVSLLADKYDVWIGLEIGSTKLCLHPWEVCLITIRQERGWEPIVEELFLKDVHLIDNPPLTARYFSYKNIDTNDIRMILYWYTRSTFQTETGYEEKWVKISVIEIIDDIRDMEVVEEDLLFFAKEIMKYWKPLSEWSLLSLFVARNGLSLISAIGFLIIMMMTYFWYLEAKKHRSAKILFEKLSLPDDVLLLSLIKKMEGKLVSIEFLKDKFNELSQKEIDIQSMKLQLDRSEESGLIKKVILNHDDEPYLSWKTYF